MHELFKFRSWDYEGREGNGSPFSKEIAYIHSKDLLADSRNIIETARKVAYRAVDVALVQRNWLLGTYYHVEYSVHQRYIGVQSSFSGMKIL